MVMLDLSPETNVLSVNGRYRPMYRLRPGDRWALVRRSGKPVECNTATEAKRIAQDVVDAIAAPVHVIEEEPAPLGKIEDWRRERSARQVAERERVFGAAPSVRVFAGGKEFRSKPPAVETRKRRARAHGRPEGLAGMVATVLQDRLVGGEGA
jgi:hypothetical protein